MKCEILTFQFAHNYGAILQCYALKKKMESYGTEGYIDGMIRYKLLLYEDIPAEEIDDCGNIVGWDTFRRYDIDR